MFVKHYRFQSTKDENLISYRFIRNLVFLCGYGNRSGFEKTYQYLYFVYLTGLMGCFVGNIVYAVNVNSNGEGSIISLSYIISTTTQYLFYLFIRFALSIYKTNVIPVDNDKKAGYKKNPKDHTASLILAILAISARVFGLVFYLFWYKRYFYVSFLHLLFFVSDIGQVTNVLSIELLWARAKFTRQILHTRLTENTSEYVKIENIKEITQFNKNWSGTMKPTEIVTKLQLLVTLLAAFIYTILVLISFKDILTNKIVFSLHLCYILLLPCASPIVYELLASELDKMKLMTVKQFAYCKDEKNRRALSELLLVWCKRNYRRTMFRIFPLDVTLPFKFISVVTTYSIVVAQFQKLI